MLSINTENTWIDTNVNEGMNGQEKMLSFVPISVVDNLQRRRKFSINTTNLACDRFKIY